MDGYDWEGLAGRSLEAIGASALRLGEQYAGVFFSRQQFEAQLDAYGRLAQLQPRPAGLPPLAILMVGAVLVLLLAKKA